MEPVAFVGIVQACYKVGTAVVDICKTWKHASKDLEVCVLMVESCWARTQLQVDALKQIAPSIDVNHRRILSDQLAELGNRLTKAMTGLDSVIRDESDASAVPRADRRSPFLSAFGSASRARVKARRAAWVWKKEAIDVVLRDLLEWQTQFDPLWLLIVKNPNPVVDAALERGRADEEARNPAGQTPSFARSPLTIAVNLRHALTETKNDGHRQRRKQNQQARKPQQPQQPRRGAELCQAVQQKDLPLQQQQPGAPARPAVPTLQQQRKIFRDPVPMETIDILYSDAQAARRPGDPGWFILDPIQCRPGVDVKVLAQDVCALATKLACADPLAFGLLNCKGVVRIPPQRLDRNGHIVSPLPSLQPRGAQSGMGTFQLLFRAPEDMEVLRSLRDLLLSTDNAHVSLSRRLCIARELAKAVGYVHTFTFVHKNIQPESVLYFEEAGQTNSSGNGPHEHNNDDHRDIADAGLWMAPRSHAFLVGFDSFRAADGGTMMVGDVSWDRNLYRHPLRQGALPPEQYRMHHDVYSLGVCLLEVGLWESFVEYDPPPVAGGRPVTRFGRIYTGFQAWLEGQGQRERAAGMSHAATGGRATVLTSNSFRLKDYLVEQARTRLPSCMGERYTWVVLSCLTCLDEDDGGGNGDEASEDDITVAVRFNEEIMKNLSEICV